MTRDQQCYMKDLSADLPEVTLLRDLLAVSARILVTTHRRPDGDAVGSVLAMSRALRARGIEATAHTPDPPPSFLRFLAGFDTITHNPGPIPAYDLVIALDHSELGRTGLANQLLTAHLPVVAIDHHATADRRASVALIIPEAAATCEILCVLFPLVGLPVDASIATCLLTGLVTDTGSFQHANTTARVLAAAGKLLELGADLRSVVTSAFGQRPLPALRIAGRALERLAVNPATGAVISVVTHEDLQACGASEQDLTGVVNVLNTLPEASFALLLTEYEKGKLSGSLRASPRTSAKGTLWGKSEQAVDVSLIAQKFGGGGHTLASGFEVAGRLVRDPEGWRIE